MYLKFFTRLFLLIGIIGMFSVPLRADEIQILGTGTQTDYNLPTHSNYNYSLTQQIYTAAEIEEAGGGAGTINSIAFYNGGSDKTRNFSVYLVNTDKESFSNATDWITVSANDLVFSGNVDMTANVWTTITFSNPFAYDGGNLAVVVDDNTGNDISGMACRIFTASSTQSIYYRNDYTNPDPTNPTISGNPTTYKNQIILDIEMASVTCAKPKDFHAESITAHSATLTWTAGAEGQSNWDVYVTTTASDVPDESTIPSYQVTECTKTLSDLTTQTTYYAYVRSACGGDDGNSKWASKTFTTTREALVVDANHPYSQDFEANNDWGFTNGTLTNNWCWGSATNHGGEKSMYVSKDGGTTHEYAHSTAVIFASKLLTFAQGTYTFTFDWKAGGESSYDYLRVALVPGDNDFTAGTLPSGVNASSLPSTWIALDGGSKLNLNTNWQTRTAEASVSGTYTMVFLWRNDGGGGDGIPAAIDNISISYMTCPRPTALTVSNIAGRSATLTWTENGTATNWVLEYATNNGFTENLVEANVSGTASKDLSGLSPEIKYYARVKSVLGNEESSWSDITDFTTTATCEKPTNWKYTPYSATAYSGSVEWEGNANGYNIAYRPTSDFDPSDETLQDVTRVTLGSVNAYTLQNLTPETKYYVYIQADCGAEDGTSSWSNRVIFTTEATCLVPSGLSATATSSTITLSWTAGAQGQDAWDIRYKKSTDSEYTYIHLDNHPTTSYTITGLSPVTTYGVNVRAWCSETDQSKWGASSANQSYDKSVTTACGAIELPYTCDFEGVLETGGHFSTYSVPKCWDRIEMQYGSYSPYTYYPYVYDYSSDAHGGTKSLRMYRTPNSATQTIIMPAIDDSYQMSDLQIRFWAKAGSSNNTLYVGVMDGDNFVELAAVEGVSSTYAEYTVPLSDYTGTGRNIAIRCGSSTGYSYLYFNIDDVLVEVIPTCLIPTGLTCTSVDVNSASFVWQPGKDETEWNIQYKKTSDSEWSNPIHVTEPPTTENPFVLTGLQRGIEYEARIQAYCDDEDQSEWNSIPVIFATDCGIWPIDAQNALFEDFSGDAFPPACWDWIRVNNYTGWQHSTNVNDPIDPTGTAFSYWPNGNTYLILPHMHINGNAKLSFDMAFSSSGSGEESSVVLSTTGKTALNFSTTLWTATEFPTTKTTVSIDLSDYDNQDVYIAFKFAGAGTSGRMWYIDNVHVYVGEIFTKDITAYSGDGGYYLIASPVGTVNPENVTNMLANNYDLYYFDQSATDGLEWINYRSNANAGGDFNLQPGKGYLYANNGNVTLTFTGVPYNGNGQFDLTYDENASLKGWNLIGNPYPTIALLDNMSYYRLNPDGNALNATTENTPVAAMEGVFVQVTEANQKANFAVVTNNGETDKVAKLNINLTQSRGASTSSATTLDNAIVRFDNGSTLGKFQLNPNHTKVYIPQGGKDYAIVRSATQGEMPVNFKAEKNGSYTLNVSAENLGMHYLHLIDNMTGADVDLLSDPSYSFEAKTTDYASRFRLVFEANENGTSTSSATFAFYNGNNWVISNPSTGSGSDATLQVIDVMGRILRSETLNGNAEINLNQPAGIYMLRLIDGENVKVQKIVVR